MSVCDAIGIPIGVDDNTGSKLGLIYELTLSDSVEFLNDHLSTLIIKQYQLRGCVVNSDRNGSGRFGIAFDTRKRQC